MDGIHFLAFDTSVSVNADNLKEDYGEFYGFQAEHAASRIMFC